MNKALTSSRDLLEVEYEAGCQRISELIYEVYNQLTSEDRMLIDEQLDLFYEHGNVTRIFTQDREKIQNLKDGTYITINKPQIMEEFINE